MKLIVDRNELWRGIDTVLDAVPAKPALPVLSNLLIEAEDNQLSLSATNLDLSIRTSVSATVQESGRTTVPARTFAEITREWPEAELTLEVKDEHLSISGQLGTVDESEGAYSLSGMPPDDFPTIPDSLSGLSVDCNAVESFDGQILSDMINKTAFAVSRDETRPVLTGVLWRLGSQGMEMVATDGSRLTWCQRSVDLQEQFDAEEKTDIVVPPQALNQLVKLLGGSTELNKLTVTESQLLFDLGDTYLVTRLIEGPYVDYEPVIPRQNDKQLIISCEHLLPAVRRVSILSSSYTHQVRLHLDKGILRLSAASQEIGGEARESIPAQYDEEEMEIGYNANYLIEILRKLGTQDVILQLNNSVTATLIRPAVPAEGEDYFCLLMPIRPSD